MAAPAYAPSLDSLQAARVRPDSIQQVSKRRPSPLRFSTALIRDVRIAAYQDLTRLVLDLDRKVHFTESRRTNPDRVIIELQNTKLGRTAQAKVTDASLPLPFTISQSQTRAVSVSLQPKALSGYKILPLTNPDRLVVDIIPQIPKTPRQGMRIADSPTPMPNTLDTQPRAILPPSSNSTKTIVVDPGHGGRDPGTVGPHGTAEKDVTLLVALQLRELLSRLPNTRVLMTRDRDVFVELEDRTRFANSKEADLFVSIHVNSHPQRNVKGLEIYHFGEAQDQRALEVAARENGTPLSSTGVGWEYLVADLLTTKKIEASLELAWTTKQAMVTHLNGRYTTTDHGVKTAPFYVLRFTTMPSILAEIAFMSNPAEEELMRNRAFVNQVAESLFEGVTAFLNSNRLTAK
ncbi:MAG: N-acetylmuramoyl-L-alanine amidase [Nitrospiraceae bacterium]